MSGATRKSILLVLGKLGITKVAHLWDHTSGSWKSFKENLRRLRNIPTDLKILTEQFLNDTQTAASITEDNPTDPDLWRWSNELPTNRGFSLTNKQTYLLLLEDNDEWAHLNLRWNRQDSEQTWRQRWNLIWRSDLTKRAKLSIWRVIINSMYNLERALKIGHRDGYCNICPGQLGSN